MNTYRATFTRNGSNGSALWPQFYTDDDRRLQLDSSWNVLENYRADQCAFWCNYTGVDTH